MANEKSLLDFFEVFPSIGPDKDDWLNTYGKPMLDEIILQRDVRDSRLITAQMLVNVLDAKAFLKKNSKGNKSLDGMNRAIRIAFLVYTARIFSLLTSEEVLQILQHKGLVDLGQFQPDEKPLLSFEELQLKTTEWKEQGFKINCFLGSFDPPTLLHLALMTEAASTGEKLLVGLDNDQLIKRKGEDRPRIRLELRRQILENFPWLVAGTFVLRPLSISDDEGFAKDYKNLGVDSVLLMHDQENLIARLNQIESAGAKPRYFEQRFGELTSTIVMEMIRSRTKEGKL